MKMNLLKMVQLILSSMDGDEVNSISDTAESLQVVDAIEQSYNDLSSTIDFPDHWDFFELEATSTATPTVMNLPSNIGKVEWIQYDHALDGVTKRDYRYIQPLAREAFFDRMNGLDSAETDIYQFDYTVGTGTFDVRGHNERFPLYYTTTDDETVIFDNFYEDINQTLVGNKTKCYGMLIPVFERDDEFIPDFAPRQFTLLFNEAKSQAFIDLKQVQNAKSEQRARRGWVQSQRKEPQVPGGNIYKFNSPNFGRRRP